VEAPPAPSPCSLPASGGQLSVNIKLFFSSVWLSVSQKNRGTLNLALFDNLAKNFGGIFDLLQLDNLVKYSSDFDFAYFHSFAKKSSDLTTHKKSKFAELGQ
jgi:hypothetical protein